MSVGEGVAEDAACVWRVCRTAERLLEGRQNNLIV